MHTNPKLIATLMVAGLGLTGCGAAGPAAEEAMKETSVKVKPISGTDLSRIELTARAARVLGIQTAPVRSARGSSTQTSPRRNSVPYSAVLYSPDGHAFTYASPARGVYVQSRIAIDRIEGGVAYLKHGPSVGSSVVTQGAEELLGAEGGVVE